MNGQCDQTEMPVLEEISALRHAEAEFGLGGFPFYRGDYPPFVTVAEKNVAMLASRRLKHEILHRVFGGVRNCSGYVFARTILDENLKAFWTIVSRR